MMAAASSYAAKSYGINRDAPLSTLSPTGGWIGREPRTYSVAAPHAEDALAVAVYIDLVCQGTVPRKYAGRVSISHEELTGRVFAVLVGMKPGPAKNDRWIATEIREISVAEEART